MPRKHLTHANVLVTLLTVLVGGFAIYTQSARAAAVTTLAGAGEGPGQVSGPAGVAVSGGVAYVADEVNSRVDEFGVGGGFVRAFGWGVIDGKAELQVCTTSTGCRGGLSGPGVGEVFPVSVAADGSGVYVYDKGQYRVEKFSAQGVFLLMFGGDVNKTTGGNVCTAQNVGEGDVCGAGAPGVGEGQFGAFKGSVALDGAGNVWVGDSERVEEFGAEGAFIKAVGLPGVEEVRGLAVDDDPSSSSFGDLYVLGENPFTGEILPEVRRYGQEGKLLGAVDVGGHPRAVGVQQASGDVFVSDQADPNTSSARILEYEPAGLQIEAFASGQIIGSPEGGALAFGEVGGREALFVASCAAANLSAVQVFSPLPAAGQPLVVSGGTEAVGVGKESVTLAATVNPEGVETKYRFQYLTRVAYEANVAGGREPFTGASLTGEAALPASFEDDPVSATVGALEPDTAYVFRVATENTGGQKGNFEEESGSFQTLPRVAIDSTSADEVTATSAVLQAQLNPLGEPASYHFEYQPQGAFEERGFTEATSVPLPDAPLASAETPQSVTEPVRGLTPDTVYHYRILAHNETLGSETGPEETFTTHTTGGESSLPDGRAYELVSPADKFGALIEPIIEQGVVQAAAGGQAMTYLANSPTEAGVPGNDNLVQVLSTRTPTGWQSRDLAIPLYGEPTGASIGKGQEYRFFSEDLSEGVLQPFGSFPPPGSPQSLSPHASEETAFLHSNFNPAGQTQPCSEECYLPLVTAANVPAGTHFGRQATKCTVIYCGPVFVGATPNLSHIVLESEPPAALTDTAITGTALYEWSAGQPPDAPLQLVSLLPPNAEGKELPASTAQLGLEGKAERNALTDDGNRIIWQLGTEPPEHLYLRDMARGQTVQLDSVQGGNGAGRPVPEFQFASSDGSRVLFTDTQKLTADAGANQEEPDLYECVIVQGAGGKLECRLSDLTPVSDGEPAAVQGGLIGASEDASWIYYAADGKQPGNPNATTGNCKSVNSKNTAPPGAVCNLYVLHEGKSRLIAVLSGEDLHDWSTSLGGLTAGVSGDGQWLAFMSQLPLTGYDNTDALSGKPDAEVYLYDAAGGRLTCASCDPTGARPHGIEYEKIYRRLAGGAGIWPATGFVAANVPGWTQYTVGASLYQSRYLSNNGRLYFDSQDALVPQDVNGTEDVYEWQPEGVGSCGSSAGTGSTVFERGRGFQDEGRAGESAAGCVSLISAGSSGEESAFLDASATGARDAQGDEGGGDVFFITASKLVPQDLDTSLDVYDAHECTTASPCIQPPEGPPPCESADACRTPPVPQPPIYGAPSSATFSGAGNLTAPAVKPPVKQRPLTRAQKLAKALKACRKQHSKHKRSSCEKLARKRYGARTSTKKRGAHR